MPPAWRPWVHRTGYRPVPHRWRRGSGRAPQTISSAAVFARGVPRTLVDPVGDHLDRLVRGQGKVLRHPVAEPRGAPELLHEDAGFAMPRDDHGAVIARARHDGGIGPGFEVADGAAAEL